METRTEHRFIAVRSTRNVLGNLPSGNVYFEYTTGSKEKTDAQHIYLSTVVDIYSTEDWNFSSVALNLDNNHGLTQNCMANLFKSATLSINDKPISQATQYAQQSTLMKLVYANPDERDVDNSVVIPIPYNQAVVANTDYDQDGTGLVNLVNGRTSAGVVSRNALHDSLHRRLLAGSPQQDSSAIIVPGGDPKKLTLHLALPLAPLFVQINPLEYLPTVKIKLEMSFDSSYINKLTVTETANPILNIDFTEMFLHIPTFKVNDIPRSPFTTRFLEGQSGQTILSTNSHQFSVSRGSIHTVLLSFGRANNTTPNADPCQFDGPFKGPKDKHLTTLYINYSSHNYPSPPYNFVEGRDYNRAYNDYKTYNRSKANATGAMLAFSEWLESPVFVFSVLPDPQSLTRHLTVELTGGAFVTGGTHYMYHTLLYENVLNIDFADDGSVGETLVGPVN